jgi:hypothetical protein
VICVAICSLASQSDIGGARADESAVHSQIDRQGIREGRKAKKIRATSNNRL